MIEERLVTVEEVNHPYAVVRDDRGATFEVQTAVVPGRRIPRAAERWVITRDLVGDWYWLGCIDLSGTGSAHVTTVGDGSTTLFEIAHDLHTSLVVVQVRNAAGVVDVDPIITVVDDNTVSVSFPAPPAVGDAVVVVLSA